MRTLLHLAPDDAIAVAMRDIEAGELLILPGGAEMRAPARVPFGFKVAVRPIAAEETVQKYRITIGTATHKIAPGEVVHVHNLRSNYIPTQRRRDDP